MTCTMTKDADAIRASLEALGYSGIQFVDSYGFITGVAVMIDGKPKAITGPLYGVHADDGRTEVEREAVHQASALTTRKTWIDGIKALVPLR